jgi:hypothetical protein
VRDAQGCNSFVVERSLAIFSTLVCSSSSGVVVRGSTFSRQLAGDFLMRQ